MSDGTGWDAATWEGNQRAQIRRALDRSVRERLEALDALAETSERLAEAGAAARRAAPARSQGAPDAAGVGVAVGVREPAIDYAGVREDGKHVIALAGCTPTPLASYLKALGVLRIVAEQADPEVRGWWEGDAFVVRTSLTSEDLEYFFLCSYQPTPILAPWNGGSGFFPKDNTSGVEPIETGRAERFRVIRDTIRDMRAALEALDIDEKPGADLKVQLLTHLRGEMNEDALGWIDAAVMLTDESPRYPPLLGTGGNDGRLDFTNNYMQRLIDVLDPDTGEAREPARPLLRSALFGDPVPALVKQAIGQFAPAAAGGPNATTGFDASSRMNPWDLVLMLEGAVLFAAAATRRLEGDAADHLSYPFTVRPNGAGSGAAALADEGGARAEMWMPLWSRPASFPELRSLLSEGRVALGRRIARDGLDFIRAVAQLGTDRGVEQFQRYSFMMRSGRAYLATPLNRVIVRRNPAADLVDQLDRNGWLARFRRFARGSNAPARSGMLVRRLEDGLFEMVSGQPERPRAVQNVLAVLGEAQRYLATSAAARERCPPVPLLNAEWVEAADDGSAGFQLATALAGLHAVQVDPNGRRTPVMPLAVHFAPVNEAVRKAWTDTHHRVVWGHGTLEANLAAVLDRRLLEADREQLPELPLAGWATAPLAAVAAWLQDEVDSAAIARLLPGLALARIPTSIAEDIEPEWPLPAAYPLLKPLFCTDAQLVRAGLVSADVRLSLPAELVRHLTTGNVSAAVKLATRRLRIAGLPPATDELEAGYENGARLLAALMVPLPDRDVRRLTARVARPA